MTENKPPKRLFTVAQFCERHPAFTEAGIRWDIFCAKARRSSHGILPGNGLDAAIIRKKRRIYIDEDAYFAWLDHQNVSAKS